jgi:hypothetical protein
MSYTTDLYVMDMCLIMKNAVFWDVALVRMDISEERISSIIGVTRVGALGRTLAVTRNRCTLRRKYFTECDRLSAPTKAVFVAFPLFTDP